MVSRYGKLVRGWDWRTTPERLTRMERHAGMLKVSQTRFLEFCVDLAINLFEFRAVEYGGTTLVLWEPAEPTSRLLSDSLRADGYAEWSALAYDSLGHAYTVSWLHKDDGREPEYYDWSKPDDVRRNRDHDIANT